MTKQKARALARARFRQADAYHFNYVAVALDGYVMGFYALDRASDIVRRWEGTGVRVFSRAEVEG